MWDGNDEVGDRASERKRNGRQQQTGRSARRAAAAAARSAGRGGFVSGLHVMEEGTRHSPASRRRESEQGDTASESDRGRRATLEKSARIATPSYSPPAGHPPPTLRLAAAVAVAAATRRGRRRRERKWDRGRRGGGAQRAIGRGGGAPQTSTRGRVPPSAARIGGACWSILGVCLFSLPAHPSPAPAPLDTLICIFLRSNHPMPRPCVRGDHGPLRPALLVLDTPPSSLVLQRPGARAEQRLDGAR